MAKPALPLSTGMPGRTPGKSKPQGLQGLSGFSEGAERGLPGGLC